MKLAVVGFKGGTYKSTISVELAYLLKLTIIDADPYGDQAGMVGENYKVVDAKSGDLPIIENSIIDFGGFAEHRNDKAIKDTDIVLLPFTVSPKSWRATIQTYLTQIKKLNRKVVFIATGYTDIEQVKFAKKSMEEALQEEITMFQIRYSRAYFGVEMEERALCDVYKNRKFNIIKEYKEIAKYIKKSVKNV